MRVEMELEKGEAFESFISIICLRMNRLPDEIENKKMSVILRTFAYIEKERKLEKERAEQQKKEIGM